MICARCKRESKHEICDPCFLVVIEKRIGKDLREAGIRPGEKICIVDDGSHLFALSKHFLVQILGDMPYTLEVVYEDSTYSTDAQSIVLPWDLDMECEHFIKGYLEGQPEDLGNFWSGGKKHVKLLISVSDEECRRLCSILSVKYVERYKTRLGDFLDKLEKDHPETKHSLKKSSGWFR